MFGIDLYNLIMIMWWLHKMAMFCHIRDWCDSKNALRCVFTLQAFLYAQAEGRKQIRKGLLQLCLEMCAQADEHQPGVPPGRTWYLYSEFICKLLLNNIIHAISCSQRACMYREAHCYKQVVTDAQVWDVILVLSFSSWNITITKHNCRQPLSPAATKQRMK